jgi:hypothetical protein
MILAVVLLGVFASFVMADVTTTFTGYQWLRYDYQVYGSSPAAVTPKSNNTFSIPRTYLTLKIADKTAGYDGNITMDINNTSGGENSGTTLGAIDWASWLKFAYVNFNTIPFLSDAGITLRVGEQKVYFAQVDTWTYPLIEKTMADKSLGIPTADQGIALDGKVPGGWGSYQLAVYNGTGFKLYDADGNTGNMYTDKCYDAALMVTPMQGLYARISYLHKTLTPLGVTSLGYNATDILIGGTVGPVDATLEYLAACNAAKYAVGKSGVSVGVSGYIAVKVLDPLSIYARIDSYNPDTRVTLDETNFYALGVNLKLAPAMTLQVDYQLDANRYTQHGTKDNNLTNNNQWETQLVWSW